MYEMTYSPSMCQHFEMCLQRNQQGGTAYVYMLCSALVRGITRSLASGRPAAALLASCTLKVP